MSQHRPKVDASLLQASKFAHLCQTATNAFLSAIISTLIEMKKMQAISIYFDACSWRISATQIGKVKQFASACLSLSPACFIVIGSKATSDSQIRLSYQRIVAIKHQLIAFGLRPKHIILAAECADSNILQHGLANTQDDEAVTPTIQSAADVEQNSGYSVVIVKPLFG